MRVAIVLVAVTLVTHVWVHWRQRDAYMDEHYHVPQAQAFCRALRRGEAPRYDAAITTPPVVYVVSAIMSPMLGCGVQALRLQAAAAVVLVGLLALRVAEGLGGGSTSSDVALAIATHPPLLFAGALYYTDAFGVGAVLAAWLLALRGRQVVASAVGLLAAGVRQTNAVWHAFVALHVCMCQGVRFSWPHVAAGFLYVAFLVLNGGQVALGDQARHTPMVHAAQLNYFAGYRLAFAFPLAAALLMTRHRSYVVHWIVAALLAASAVYSTGDYVHPFSLADNRHYVFYVYRKLLRHQVVRYALIPLYAAGYVLPFLVAASDYAKAVEKTWLKRPAVVYALLQAAALAATAVTVVPAPLFEPRYFIPGYVVSMMLALVRIRNRSICRVIVALNLLVYFGLVGIFAELPFERPPDPHMPADTSMGRFML